MRRRGLSFNTNSPFFNDDDNGCMTEPNQKGYLSMFDPDPVENSLQAVYRIGFGHKNFSHFSAVRRFWEYLIYLVSFLPIMETSFISIFIRDIKFSAYFPFMVTDILFIIDLYVVFNTSYISHGVIVNAKAKIKRKYGTFSIVCHTLGAIPFSWIGVMVDNWIVYLVLSIPGLFRIRRALIAHENFKSNLIYYSWISALFPLAVVLVLFIHCFACFFYLCAYFEGIKDSWIGYLGWDELTPPQLYVTSIYFVMTTVLCIGFGDLTPQTSQETIVVIFIQCIGVFANIMILSRLVSLAIDAIDGDFLYKVKEFLDFLSFKKIPESLIAESLNFFQMKYNEGKGADDPSQMARYLPETLRNHINLDQCKSNLKKIELFKGVNESLNAGIASILTPRAFCPGDVIIKNGEVKSELILLKTGLVKVTNNYGDTELVSCEGGISFGDVEIFVDKQRDKTVVASTFVSGWSISRVDFQLCMAHRPEMRKELLSVAKVVMPSHYKTIRAITSHRAIEDLLQEFSQSDSSDSDLFMGVQLDDTSSEGSFEIL